jgi:hypothetical protein
MALSLKSKITSAAFFILTISLVNCSEPSKESTEKNEAVKDSVSCEKPPLNPNGDSELSLLMRDMVKNSEDLRKQVQNGKLDGTFPEKFFKIYTAKPTDSDTKKESFKAYADNYLSSLRKLYDSPKEELNTNYNSLINACASCHSEHCPGPLRKIHKLILN